MQKMMGMPTPNNRMEFEHNLGLVIEDFYWKIDSGKEGMIGNAAHFTLPHLRKLRLLPNRRINLLTIDERLRLSANHLNAMQNMPFPEPKEIEDVQKKD